MHMEFNVDSMRSRVVRDAADREKRDKAMAATKRNNKGKTLESMFPPGTDIAFDTKGKPMARKKINPDNLPVF